MLIAAKIMIAKSIFTLAKRSLRPAAALSFLGESGTLCAPFSVLNDSDMQFNEKQKKYLRGLGHQLHPVIMVGGKGLTEAVIKETELALDHHELIKIKIAGERDERRQIIDEICEQTKATLIQSVGGMALVFRRNPENPKISV